MRAMPTDAQMHHITHIDDDTVQGYSNLIPGTGHASSSASLANMCWC